ncbi:MAG: SlyX family protein [Phycisphaerales bacterium]
MSSDQHPHPAPHPHAPGPHAREPLAPAAALETRLSRLEESALFSERMNDELSGQLRALFDAVNSVSRRMDLLDRRLGQVQSQLEADDPGPEKPPHSA